MSELCYICEERYLTVWHVSNELWMEVTGIPDGSGLLCISCFDTLAWEQGIFLYWESKRNHYPTELDNKDYSA